MRANIIKSSTSPRIATTSYPGVVKPDGTTITMDADGTIHAENGDGMALDDVTGATATSYHQTVSLTWTDPTDKVIGGVTVAEWASTKIVRKVGSAPSSYTDGTLIATETTRNQYSSSPLVDNTVQYGVTYYYRFFPVTTRNMVTDGSSVSITPAREIVPTPEPASSLTYTGSEQTMNFSSYDSSQVDLISGNTGTNAGSYTALFQPKSDYMWSDGTQTQKGVSWSIAKANGSITLSKNSVSLSTSQLTDTVTISSATGEVTGVSSSDTSVATASLSGSTITISSVNATSGSATVTVSAAASSNYDAVSVQISVSATFIDSVLDNNSWAAISAASSAGIASTYWSVGDCKKVTLNGIVGTLSLSNYDTYVFILGFDHNSSLEGTGISFGTFKTALTGGTDVALCDPHYNSYDTSGSKWFNMQHWGNPNYGGWKGCDLRYDILGSTDSAPEGYGSQAQSGRTGVNASSTTATSPIAKTLMAALPSDLRAVMKPITKYSDNVAGGTNVQSNVTASVDYLPLLAEYEVQGASTYANQHEQSSQAQYTYYINGNSKIKYNHSSTSSAVRWWCRSAGYSDANGFCDVNTDGSAHGSGSRYSRGLAVAFLI